MKLFFTQRPALGLLAILLVSFTTLPSSNCQAQYLSPSVLKAAEAARMGSATRQQQALLFMNNDAINQARLSGYIPDSTYQAAQREYSSLNQKFAQAAAESTGADFTVQQSSSQTYSPGTDSDYIVTTNSGDPVEQIREMQSRYNDSVNSYLDDALGPDSGHMQRGDWHNQLDVDFMADPAHVTDQQFREIAELNNDAYTRRGSAEYERRSRAGGLEVTPDQFTDYANEMQDFVDKKQKYLDKIKKNPSSLTDPKTMAEQHRLMAQEAKYTSRIQQANDLLREQEGLSTRKKPKGPPVYEITEHPNGKTSIRRRSTGTLAEQGASRSPTNRARTATASAVATNSVQQAVTELSESMAEAAAKNPSKWPNAQAQIADMAERLPPAAKGQLLERVAARRQATALQDILSKSGDLDDAGMNAARAQARKVGNDYSKGVAREMQQRIRSQRGLGVRTDRALQSALGLTDDMSQLRGLRGTMNRRTASLMGGVEKFGNIGIALEVAGAGYSAYSGLNNLYNARDPNLTAAEMREMHRRAGEDFARLGSQGLLAGVSYAVPTLGAIIGGYDMGYGAGRYVLENTAIGRAVDAAALEGFDEAFQAWESLWERYEGRGKLVAEEAERRRKLEESYWNALRNGTIRMKPGTTIEEFMRRLREGDLASVRDLFEPGPNASQATIDRFADKKPVKPKNPNDDLEWINQTFEPAGDTEAREAFHQLTSEGKSPIGPVINPNRTEGIATPVRPDYRARAEQIVRNQRSRTPVPGEPNYRGKAEQINQRVIAVEQERARQARIAEARRQEAIRRQQIAAQQARARQIAQQQAWARQQQYARQQAAINSYWRAQQAAQQWQRTTVPYRAAPLDGSILGNNYDGRSRYGGYGGYGGSTQSVSEADYYNNSENPIRW
jgi:hypothetical protein